MIYLLWVYDGNHNAEIIHAAFPTNNQAERYYEDYNERNNWLDYSIVPVDFMDYRKL